MKINNFDFTLLFICVLFPVCKNQNTQQSDKPSKEENNKWQLHISCWIIDKLITY